MVAAAYLGFSREDRIAVGIAGSQKTLMVGLQMGLEIKLSILPIVVYHVGQLLLDTIIADRLRASVAENRETKKAGPDRTSD
jgi:sodium/bile acid cotransporter 7